MANISELEEAELKVQTEMMFRNGGLENVLACINTMQRCQIIILTKLNELLEDENRNRN